MWLALVDGVLYAAMVGAGESSFVPTAEKLNATVPELGLVVGLPLALGAIGPLLALLWIGRFQNRRPLVVIATSIQTALVFVVPWLDRLGEHAPAAMIGLCCLYQVCGQAAGTAWASWFGDLVPVSVRARYFSFRTSLIQASTFVFQLTAGLLLHFLTSESSVGARLGIGFQWVFAIASGCRLLSTLSLAASPEPPFPEATRPSELTRALRHDLGSAGSRLIFTAASVSLLVYVSSPYFGPFMLRGLGFNSFEYMLALGVVVAFKVLFLPSWGRAIERYGPGPVFRLSALLVSLVPLPWLLADGLFWALVGQAFSGFAWAGYELGLFTLQLGVSTKKSRPLLFAAHSLFNGLGQLGGTLVGGWFLGAAPQASTYRWLFFVSMLGRVFSALVARRLLPRADELQPVRQRDLLLRVIGFRPHGGLTHRPDLTRDEMDSREDEGGNPSSIPDVARKTPNPG